MAQSNLNPVYSILNGWNFSKPRSSSTKKKQIKLWKMKTMKDCLRQNMSDMGLHDFV